MLPTLYVYFCRKLLAFLVQTEMLPLLPTETHKQKVSVQYPKTGKSFAASFEILRVCQTSTLDGLKFK